VLLTADLEFHAPVRGVGFVPHPFADRCHFWGCDDIPGRLRARSRRVGATHRGEDLASGWLHATDKGLAFRFGPHRLRERGPCPGARIDVGFVPYPFAIP